MLKSTILKWTAVLLIVPGIPVLAKTVTSARISTAKPADVKPASGVESKQLADAIAALSKPTPLTDLRDSAKPAVKTTLATKSATKGHTTTLASKLLKSKAALAAKAKLAALKAAAAKKAALLAAKRKAALASALKTSAAPKAKPTVALAKPKPATPSGAAAPRPIVAEAPLQ